MVAACTHAKLALHHHVKMLDEKFSWINSAPFLSPLFPPPPLLSPPPPSSSQALQGCGVLGVVEGGGEEEERRRSAEQTARRPVDGNQCMGYAAVMSTVVDGNQCMGC